MKKVLMISPFFIPRRRVGALRVFKFAIHLKDFGYQPGILSVQDDSGILTEKETELLEGIPQFSISPPFDKTSNHDLPQNKAPEKEKMSGFSPAAWVDKHTPMDTWIYLFLLRYSSIMKIAKEWNPDIVWATGDPLSALWLGRKIAKSLHKPFVADFRDPWVPGGVSLRQRSAFSSLFDRRAERQIVKEAARMVFTSRSTEQAYREYYDLNPDVTTTIYNSSSRLLVESTDHETGPRLSEEGKFTLLFFGRFRRLSPAEPIISTIQTLKEHEGEKIGELLEIHSFGRPDPHQSELIAESGLEKMFIFHDIIPPEKSASVLNEADLLLLTTHKERKLVIPAKLWEYLNANPPVLSIAPNPEIGEIINQLEKGCHAGPDNPGIAARYLAEQIRKKMKGEADQHSTPIAESMRDRYGSYETTRTLSLLFDDLLRGEDEE